MKLLPSYVELFEGSLFNNQYFMETKGLVFFRGNPETIPSIGPLFCLIFMVFMDREIYHSPPRGWRDDMNFMPRLFAHWSRQVHHGQLWPCK